MWVYVPLRETYEMQSQGYTGPLQTSAAHPVNDAAMAIKDSDMKEIGLFKARLAFGAQAIPFTLKWAFNDWAIDDNATAAMTIGKREWVRNRFQLGNMLVVTHQVARWPQITTFRPVPPHGSFYKSGDLVTLELISTWFGDDISIRFDGITAAGTSVSPSESIGNGQYRHVVTFTWTGASDGDNVGPLLGQRGDYYWVYADFGSPVQGTASCGLFRDTQAPTPAQFSLPATTPANYVILDWTACPGADNSDGTLPPPDECGIANYVVNRKRHYYPVSFENRGPRLEQRHEWPVNDGDRLETELWNVEPAMEQGFGWSRVERESCRRAWKHDAEMGRERALFWLDHELLHPVWHVTHGAVQHAPVRH